MTLLSGGISYMPWIKERWKLFLTKREEDMAAGVYGKGIEKAMKILVKFGNAFGAEKLVKITSAHTMPVEPLELLKEFAEDVEEVAVFTTLHPLMSAFSPDKYESMGIDRDFAGEELPVSEKRAEIHKRLGFNRTYSCLPQLAGNLPRRGESISWIGTGAQIMANSLLGARTNRDGTVINLCSALTGRTPLWGMHLDENRKAQVLVKFIGINFDTITDCQIGAIGYHIGAIARNRNVVFEGIPRNFGLDLLKYLMAPLSTSGSVSICHLTGITPEAPDSQTALGGKKPDEVVTVGEKEVLATWQKFREASRDEVDLVIIGCPHCTIGEIKSIAGLLDGKKIGNNQRLWLGTAEQNYRLAQLMGYAGIIETAGGVISSTCMATVPCSPLPGDVKVVKTNSFKAAHYITSFQRGKVSVVVDDIVGCIKSAISGCAEVR